MAGKIATSVLALASAAYAVNPLSVKGSNFVDPKGNRFDIVGVAYQPGGSAGYNPGSGIDPLSDSQQCLRDAAILQQLGVNTIRVYNLDPLLSHDDCAGIFDAAGIYMIIDVNSPLPGEALNAAEPWTTYTKDYMMRVFQVIEAFKGYPNLIGFFSGNEVINDMNSGKIDPPYIRAVTRDMKSYIKKNLPNRAIPVGYSAADVREILVDTSNYLQCQLSGDSDNLSRIDFFGLNSYSWCGMSDFQKSGYDQLVKDFSSTTVPVFFSEYGCNEVKPRVFTEVQAIYGPQMTAFSGGVVYEYTQEDNNFGLVKLNSDKSADLLGDFAALQGQLSKLDASKISTASSPSGQQVKCDPKLISSSGFNSNFTLPATPPEVQDMINKGVSGAAGGKNANRPSNYKCPVTVKDPSGKVLQNLAIKPVDEGATTFVQTGSNTGTSTTDSAAAASSSNAATPLAVSPVGILAAIAGLLML